MLYTYPDLLDYAEDVLRAEGVGHSQSALRRAVTAALERLPALADWWWYHGTIEVEMMGSVDYAVTYTADARTLTLTEGTWPSWVIGCAVKCSDDWGRIEVADAIEPTTKVLLVEAERPAEDFTGTATVYHDVYRVPVRVQKVREAWYGLHRLAPSTLDTVTAAKGGLCWSSAPTSYYPRRVPWEERTWLGLWPYPSDAELLRITVRRQPILPPIVGFEPGANAGTITMTEGSRIVIGADTSWSAELYDGQVLCRHRTDKVHPIASEPFVDRWRIQRVVDATTLYLYEASPYTVSDARYRIAGWIDVNDGLWALLKALVANEVAILAGRESDIAKVPLAAAFMEARRTNASTAITSYVDPGGGGQYIRLADMPLGPTID